MTNDICSEWGDLAFGTGVGVGECVHVLVVDFLIGMDVWTEGVKP